MGGAMPWVWIASGLVILIWSAGRFVDGAVRLSQLMGVPAMIIGMLIVGLGTSAPEMFVSAQAAIQGTPKIAIGNAFGSNIANIAVILGVTATILPITVQSRIILREIPILLLATLLTLGLLWDGNLSRIDGGILLFSFLTLLCWMVREARRPVSENDKYHSDITANLPQIDMTKEIAGEMDGMVGNMGEITVNHIKNTTGNEGSGESAKRRNSFRGRMVQAIFWIVFGLILMVLGSRMLVRGAVDVATLLGVSDLIIGLTIVAMGTSLPELASSMMAARRGENDLVMGNIVGSNLFNVLVVTGLAGAIHPFEVEPVVLYRDGAVMFGLTILLLWVCYPFRPFGRFNPFHPSQPGVIHRWEGGILVVTWLVYLAFLI